MNFTHFMLHCFYTPAGQWFDRKDLIRWHIEQRGWSRVGYSMIWLLDGTTDIIIPFDNDDTIESWEISNGAAGWNGRTRHAAYVGGKEGDTRTDAQKAAMQAAMKFQIIMNPNIKFIGHNQVNRDKHYCPGFDVPDYCDLIGIPEDNIDRNIYFNPA